MDHFKDAFDYYMQGFNCRFIISELPGIVDGKAESEQDFQKRMLCQKSHAELLRILIENIEDENYEFCCVIRDLAKERGLNLIP